MLRIDYFWQCFAVTCPISASRDNSRRQDMQGKRFSPKIVEYTNTAWDLGGIEHECEATGLSAWRFSLAHNGFQYTRRGISQRDKSSDRNENGGTAKSPTAIPVFGFYRKKIQAV